MTGGIIGEAFADWLHSEKGNLVQYRTENVPDMEAANCVYINGVIIRRSQVDFPSSEATWRRVGGKQVTVEATELAMVDGALSCCSLLF